MTTAQPQAHLLLAQAQPADCLRALLLNLNVVPVQHAPSPDVPARIGQALAGQPHGVAVVGLDALGSHGHTLLTLRAAVPDAQRAQVLVVQRPDAYVLPSMRAWVRALGFADLVTEVSPAALLAPPQAPTPAPRAAIQTALQPPTAVALTLARLCGRTLDAAQATRYFRAMGVDDPAGSARAPREQVRQHTGLEAEDLAQLWAGSVRSLTRSYRLQSYPACFVGREATHWLAERFGLRRPAAVTVGQALAALGLVHHVVHAHNFEDAELFYRSAISGAVERIHIEALLATLTRKAGLQITDRAYGKTTYKNCFVGAQAIDIVCKHYKLQRHEALPLLDRLHALGLITHVTREHRMQDGNFFYQLHFS